MSVLLSVYEDNGRKAYVYLEQNKYMVIMQEHDKEYTKHFTRKSLAENEAEDWVLKENLGE